MKGHQGYDVDDMSQVQCGKQTFTCQRQLRRTAPLLEMPRTVFDKDQEQYADIL
jgi:hypothetical protein